MEVNNIKFDLRENTWDEYVLGDELLRDVYEAGFPKTTVDIGAHIGGTSLLCASRGAKVYAYEPSKINFQQLLKNIKLNNFEDRIVAKRLAVGKTGKRKLYHHNTNLGCFSFNRDNTTGMTDDYEEVSVISVKKVFKDIDHCDFLKIDCEGAEVEFYRDLPIDKIDRISIELHGREEDSRIIEYFKKYYQIKIIKDILICKKI